MTVEIPAGAIVAIIVVAILFLAYRFRAKILPPHTVTPPAPGPTPAPTPAPVPDPVPVTPAPPAVDPNNLADFFIDRDDLMKRIGNGWQYAVVIDGVTVHNGFGPPDTFTTQPNGSLAKVKP